MYSYYTKRMSVSFLTFILEAALMTIFDVLLFQSRDDLDKYRDIFPNKTNVYYIGNGVDLNKFRPSAKKTKSNKQALQVLFVGRLTKEKGIFELFNAVERINLGSKVPKVILSVCGDISADERNPAAGSLEELKKKYNNQAIKFTGFSSNVREHLRDTDIFILPSYREGMPRSLIEALAMGIPICATNIRGCSEIISNGVNGFLFSPRQSSSIIETFHRFIEHPCLLEKFSKENLNIRAQYSERLVFQRIRAGYGF